MSQLKLTADGGGGTVAIKGPASTTGNGAFELTLPGTGNATLLTSASTTGKILQVQSTTKVDTFTHSNLAESTYSNAAMSLNITPTNASNKILILVKAVVSTFVADTRIAMGLFKDGSILVQGDGSGNRTRATAETYQAIQASAETIAADFYDTAGGTSQITYDIRFMHSQGNGANLYFNRSGLDHNSIGYYRTVSTMTAMEVAV